MSDAWPDEWESKDPKPVSDATPENPSLTNDNGHLLLFGGQKEAYLWYYSRGCDVDTEPRQ